MNIFKHKLLRPISAAIFLSVLLLNGCKKKDDGVGDNILPQEVLLGANAIDSVSLFSVTQLDDSVRADGFESVMLGAMNDPEFGVTRSGFYTQVRLSANQVIFNFEEFQIDSVVLSLVYDDQYGAEYLQEYEVYELEEQLHSDSTYFTKRIMDVVETDLVLPESKFQEPAPETSVYLAGDTVARDPQLRLLLDHEIGERVLTASSTDLANNTNFTSFLKGFYVTVSEQAIPPGSGGIHYFDLHHADSKITIFYQSIAGGDTTPSSFDLIINNNAVKFSRPTHDYSMANNQLVSQLNDDEEAGQHTVFVQAAAGLRTVIEIPGLENFNNDTMAINKAELVLPYIADDTYSPPGRVYLLGRNPGGAAYFLPDYFEGDGHMGGFMIPSQSEYRLNISRWVQQVIYGSRENTPLEVVSEWASTSANRVILYGPEHPEKQMRLVLYYTKY